MKGYVYKLTNNVNGKGYVGLTTLTPEKRLQGHLSSSDKGSAFVFHKAIRKYGLDSFSLSVLEEVESEERSELKRLLAEREIFYIANENCHISEHGYNMTIGGEGVVGNSLTDAQKKEVSKRFKKLWTTEEYRAKVLNGVTTYWDSDRSKENRKALSKESSSRKRTSEQLEAMRIGYDNSRKTEPEKWDRVAKRISEAKTGVPLAEETKKKISESTKGVPKSVTHKKNISEGQKEKYNKSLDYQERVVRMVKNAHTPEANRKRSESKRRFDAAHPGRFVGDKNPNATKILYVPENIIFNSRKEAAEFAECFPTTIRRWILNPNRSDWEYYKGEK